MKRLAFISAFLSAGLASLASTPAAGPEASTSIATNPPATWQVSVKGMVCAHCAQSVDKALRKNDSVADVFIHVPSGSVFVLARAGREIPPAALSEPIQNLGFDVQSVLPSKKPFPVIKKELDTPAAPHG